MVNKSILTVLMTGLIISSVPAQAGFWDTCKYYTKLGGSTALTGIGLLTAFNKPQRNFLKDNQRQLHITEEAMCRGTGKLNHYNLECKKALWLQRCNYHNALSNRVMKQVINLADYRHNLFTRRKESRNIVLFTTILGTALTGTGLYSFWKVVV